MSELTTFQLLKGLVVEDGGHGVCMRVRVRVRVVV